MKTKYLLPTLFLLIFAQASFAQRSTTTTMCPNLPAEDFGLLDLHMYNAWMNANPADAYVEQALGQIAARWAPYSPVRAKRVFDRGVQLLRNVQWVWTLPKSDAPRPEGTPSNCTIETTATLDNQGRMVAAKKLWLALPAIDRAAYTLQLAIAAEVDQPTVKAMEAIRMLVGLIVQGNELSEKYVIMAGSLISKTFYREVFFQNGDYALELPSYLGSTDIANNRSYCGYSINGLPPVNECSDESVDYRIKSLDNSKILRITRGNSPKPVYVFPPEALGMPAHATDYVFHSYFSAEFGDDADMAITFDREMSFANSQLEMKCRANSPVIFTVAKAELQKYDFSNLRFRGCRTSGTSKLLLNGEFVDLPLQVKIQKFEEAWMPNEARLNVSARAKIVFGKYPIQIDPADTIGLKLGAVEIEFEAKTKQAIELTGSNCKPVLLSLSEQAAGRWLNLRTKNICLITGPNSKVSIKGEIRVDAVSGQILNASEGSITFKNQTIRANSVRFRANGDLESFEPIPTSEGFKYFDTVLKVWLKKERYFPHLAKLCFNPDLQRFEDRGQDQACF